MSKRTKSDLILGLMFASGFILLLSALPAGITTALLAYYKHHFEKDDAIVLASVMATSTAAIGAVFVYAAEIINKRRHKP